MKLSLLGTVAFMSKYSTIVLSIICVLSSTVMASEGKAQKYVSVYETYIETEFKNLSLVQALKKLKF